MSVPAFKQLTVENWLKPDPVCVLFGRLSPAGDPIPVEGVEWARLFLEAKLTKEVPIEIAELFEIARGVFVYGYFFYPLYAFGAARLSQVAEAAISFKHDELALSTKKIPLARKIDYLVEKKVIDQEDAEIWRVMKEFRNQASHPKEKEIWTQAMALNLMMAIVKLVNDLFSGH